MWSQHVCAVINQTTRGTLKGPNLKRHLSMFPRNAGKLLQHFVSTFARGTQWDGQHQWRDQELSTFQVGTSQRDRLLVLMQRLDPKLLASTDVT